MCYKKNWKRKRHQKKEERNPNEPSHFKWSDFCWLFIRNVFYLKVPNQIAFWVVVFLFLSRCIGINRSKWEEGRGTPLPFNMFYCFMCHLLTHCKLFEMNCVCVSLSAYIPTTARTKQQQQQRQRHRDGSNSKWYFVQFMKRVILYSCVCVCVRMDQLSV